MKLSFSLLSRPGYIEIRNHKTKEIFIEEISYDFLSRIKIEMGHVIIQDYQIPTDEFILNLKHEIITIINKINSEPSTMNLSLLLAIDELAKVSDIDIIDILEEFPLVQTNYLQHILEAEKLLQFTETELASHSAPEQNATDEHDDDEEYGFILSSASAMNLTKDNHSQIEFAGAISEESFTKYYHHQAADK
jgi:hypothetical protein